MHMVSKMDKLLRIWDCGSFQNSSNGYYSQWSCVNKRGCNSVCQRTGVVRDSESLRRYTSSGLARKALRRTRIFLLVDQWSISPFCADETERDLI